MFSLITCILIYNAFVKDHIEHLKSVFKVLRENKLLAKLSKCLFCRNSLSFLGHIIDVDGVHFDPKKIKAMVEWPKPKNLKS